MFILTGILPHILSICFEHGPTLAFIASVGLLAFVGLKRNRSSQPDRSTLNCR
jgi:hypothetical protein